MTALQVMPELLPPSRWDSQWWICLRPCKLHGCCWKGRKSLALFNPCSYFRFSSAASCWWRVFTKPLCCALYGMLYPEVGTVCKVSGSCASGCSAAGPGLWILTSPMVSVMGLVFLEPQRPVSAVIAWTFWGNQEFTVYFGTYKSERINF